MSGFLRSVSNERYWRGLLVLTERRAAWADKWFQELQNMHKNVYSVLKDPLTESDKSKFVKVAVLDTGMDLNHDEFKPFLKDKQIVAYWDFIKGSDSIIDLDGHGTHVSHLLLKTAKHAMLYHGRVFESSEADEKTAGLVAKVRHLELGHSVMN